MRYMHLPRDTTLEDWQRSDAYHNSFLIPQDDILETVSKHSVEQGLPHERAVSAAYGKFLHLLAKSITAKRVLEVGTLGGYSAIVFARALPKDGQVITLELSPQYAKVAEENVKAAGLENQVTVIVGRAANSLAQMRPQLNELFDLVFIDADKESSLTYFTEAKRLVRSGGIIIVDNVVRDGYVAIPEYMDQCVEGVRRLLEAMKGDDEIEATTISTVGEKGYDGFIYAIRK